MAFTIDHEDSETKARAGELATAHGTIPTPIFMPVGTLATVKGVHVGELENAIDAPIILANTYHLYLRPGLDLLRSAGGVHRFMGWQRPMLTDSGGYQVYSLADRRTISEEGVTFRSHIDGSAHHFTPESVMDVQRAIGADIIMAFDECPPYPCDRDYARRSMEMTHRWLDRCIERFRATEGLYGYDQMLFPIVQGSTDPDLRRASADFVASRDLPGNAIGGLSVGEPHEDMYAMTEVVCDILPADKPRYLMGVGTPENILENIALGVDMFDCVMPTRNARNGMLFTRQGIINIKNARWRDDLTPIDPKSAAPTSRLHTKAYLHHLFRTKERLGPQIASIHNLAFYMWLVRTARDRIAAGDFRRWKEATVPVLMQRL